MKYTVPLIANCIQHINCYGSVEFAYQMDTACTYVFGFSYEGTLNLSMDHYKIKHH